MCEGMLQLAWEHADLQRWLVYKNCFGKMRMPEKLKIAPNDAGTQRCSNKRDILQQCCKASSKV